MKKGCIQLLNRARRYQRLNSYVISRKYASSSNLTRDLYSDNTRVDNKVTLNYDPTTENSDFTSYGILPFFQIKANEIFKVNSRVNKDDNEPINARPTIDQKKILSILNSNHSLIFSGGVGTGKSMSLLLHSINASVSKVPTFGIISKAPSVQSIIVVPTSSLIMKYKSFVKALTQDIPTHCCPDSLIVKNSANQEDIETTYKPLTIEFIDRDNGSELFSTAGSETAEVPHVLITTPEKLYDIVVNDERGYFTKKEHTSETTFFAVDEMELILNTTDISGNSNYTRTGKKQKYVNKIEPIISTIQKEQFKHYCDGLTKRLRNSEVIYAKKNAIKIPKNFNHSMFVFENNTLSVKTVDEHIRKLHADDSTLPINGDLLRRLVKQKRKFLYKPLQFCFVIRPQNSNQMMLNSMLRENVRKSLDAAIQNNLESIGGSSRKLKEVYESYLVDKKTLLNKKDTNIYSSYIEKIIRFDDQERKIRKEERKLLSVGNFSSVNGGGKDKLNARILDIQTLSSTGDQIYSVDIKPPGAFDLVRFMEKEVINSSYNLKNEYKVFIKKRLSSQQYIDPNKVVGILTQIIANSNSLQNTPFQVVVPPYLDCKIICDSLNVSYNSLTFNTLQEGSKEQCNLIIHPDQLIGQFFPSYSNMIILGIDCLVPQTAFCDWSLSSTSVKDVTGIFNPLSELWYFYIDRVRQANSQEKEILFVPNLYEPEEVKLENMIRFGRSYLFNDLQNALTLSSELGHIKKLYIDDHLELKVVTV